MVTAQGEARSCDKKYIEDDENDEDNNDGVAKPSQMKGKEREGKNRQHTLIKAAQHH